MNVILEERTRRLLEEPWLEGQDLDTKIRCLLEAEYLRRLKQYRRLDQMLSQKYGMTFEEFIDRRITRQAGYTWDVEKDAMDWEAAVGGIQTLERKLQDLEHGREA
jgi:hypothetical protein